MVEDEDSRIVAGFFSLRRSVHRAHAYGVYLLLAGNWGMDDAQWPRKILWRRADGGVLAEGPMVETPESSPPAALFRTGERLDPNLFVALAGDNLTFGRGFLILSDAPPFGWVTFSLPRLKSILNLGFIKQFDFAVSTQPTKDDYYANGLCIDKSS